MSIGGVSAYATGQASQLLSFLLNRLAPVQTSTSGNSNSTAAASAAAAPASGSDTMLTGSTKAQLSDQILRVLTMMQANVGAAQNGTAPASSTTSQSPLSTLVSAIDTDGDGSISQSEMESYVEGLGGTQAQADALFTGLDPSGSGSLTQAQLTSDLQNAGASGQMHGHHHHHHGVSAGHVASQLMQAMDSDNDGSISQSEFENFVTGLGGTTSEADSDFAALNAQGASGITASQLTNDIGSFMKNGQPSASSGNPILTLLDDLASNANANTGTTAATNNTNTSGTASA